MCLHTMRLSLTLPLDQGVDIFDRANQGKALKAQKGGGLSGMAVRGAPAS